MFHDNIVASMRVPVASDLSHVATRDASASKLLRKLPTMIGSAEDNTSSCCTLWKCFVFDHTNEIILHVHFLLADWAIRSSAALHRLEFHQRRTDCMMLKLISGSRPDMVQSTASYPNSIDHQWHRGKGIQQRSPDVQFKVIPPL